MLLYKSFESYLEGAFAPLYHSMNLMKAYHAMKRDTLYGSMVQKYEDGQRKIENGISLTRNKNLRYKDQSDEANDVQFVFDTDKLKNHYKLFPFDYWKGKYGIRIRKGDYVNKDEDEEILVGSIKNLHKFVTEIEINSKLITYFKNPKPYSYVDGYYENFVSELEKFIKMNPEIKITGYGEKYVWIGLKRIKWNDTEIKIDLL